MAGRDARIVLALDGRSGTGKSTLAAALASAIDATVVETDDFFSGGTTTMREPARVIVLDGVYSARPELAELVDIAVLLTLSDAERRRRLLAREGAEFMADWHSIWDIVEDLYFTRVRPPDAFDVVIRC